MTIIGGADGPTAVFIAGKTSGISWLNVSGLILVILLLIPNIVFAVKHKNQTNRCSNRFMNILEQIGRYACMFLMIFNIGIAEFGFTSMALFLLYAVGSLLLILGYWITWIFYFKEETWKCQLTLAILPTLLFLLCGITMKHYLLVMFGILFGIGHIYVTAKNWED